jgi:hypothetical protein
MEFKLGDISLKLTNVAVVTGPTSADGEFPEKPLPLKPDTLVGPNDGFWITFDYETNFKASDAPEGISFLSVGIEMPEGKCWGGFNPIGIDKPSGHDAVMLMLNRQSKVSEISETIQLIAGGKKNDGGKLKAVAERGILIACKLDGIVSLSSTQFDAIQSRLSELEAKVQRLEAARTK